MNKLKSLQNRLVKAGFSVKSETLYNIDGYGVNAPCLVVDTDYLGPYPSQDTMNAVDFIRNACKGNVWMECRGYYRAVYVREWLIDDMGRRF